jgi:hypothetical protein
VFRTKYTSETLFVGVTGTFLGIVRTVSTGIPDLVGPCCASMLGTKTLHSTLFVGVTGTFLGGLGTVATGIPDFVGSY